MFPGYIMVDSVCLFKPGFIDCNHDFLISLCENWFLIYNEKSPALILDEKKDKRDDDKSLFSDDRFTF